MRIDIKDGVTSKISQRVFRIAELHQCVYSKANCFEADHGAKVDPAIAFNLTFVFKDKNVEPFEIKFSKSVL
jgi:hypothetical protein